VAIKAETEADIQRACLAYLRLLGAWAVRVNTGAVRVGRRLVRFSDTVGCPDLLFTIGGRFCAAEIKKPGGRLRASQAAQLDAIRAAGGLGVVVRSVAELEAVLRAEGLA